MYRSVLKSAYRLYRRDYCVLALVYTLLRGRLGIPGLISSEGECHLLGDKLRGVNS